MEEYEHNQSAAPLLELDYRLSGEEILACLKQDQRMAGKGKRTVQTAVLMMMAAFFLTGYLTAEEKQVFSLFMAGACLLLIAAIWIVPRLYISRRAKLAAEDAPRLHIRMYDKEICFDGDKKVTLPLQECGPFLSGDLIILEIGRELVGIPRRAAGEDGFHLLLEKFGLKAADQT